MLACYELIRIGMRVSFQTVVPCISLSILLSTFVRPCGNSTAAITTASHQLFFLIPSVLKY